MSVAVATHAPSRSGFSLKEWVFSTDHKRIAVLYLILSIAAFVVSGILALVMRLNNAHVFTFADGSFYNAALYFHGAAMILAFLIPGLTGFLANLLIPLMIGARDVAFPRINSLSLWLYAVAVVLALVGLAVPDRLDIMWTGYPPYSVRTEGNTTFYVFVVHLIGFSSILGAVNFLVTIFYMRAPGMTWNKLNIFVWATLGAFIIQLIFVPVLAAAVTLLLFDKYLGTHFYDPAAGGDVLLYQNLFWFYSHPAVYVILLPAIGVLFDIAATMGKNRVFNYRICVWGGIIGTVAISGEVWVHHLYVAGMPDWLRIGQMVTTLMISVPVGLMTISLAGTLYRAAITYNVSMLYVGACLFLFLIGGLTGIPLATTVMDVHLNHTAFVSSHFHFVMAMFCTFAIFGGVYHWFPKMTGRIADNKFAVIGFWTNLIGVNLTFFPLFIIGVEGMPRRYWDYSAFPQFLPYHQLATVGAIITAIGVTITILNWVISAINGRPSGDNPWKSKSLEWTHCPSPAPAGNFPVDPVLGEDWSPYEYKR